jgi:ferredoxin
VVVKKKLCNHCGLCAAACPVEAIFIDQEGEPFVCLHCGLCVPSCPHDCLELAEVSSLRLPSPSNSTEPVS